MAAKLKRSSPTPDDGSNHPIAWFSALLRGVDQRDRRLIEKAQIRLKELGYSVVLIPPLATRRPGGVS